MMPSFFAVKPIKMTDLNAFSTTHYHIPQDIAVERTTKEERVTIVILWNINSWNYSWSVTLKQYDMVTKNLSLFY